MSLNNGVYILCTDGPEFRVAYAHAIDNIYGNFITESKSWTPNVENLLRYFKNSKIYTSLDDAMKEAVNIDQDIYTEDGICIIKEFQNYAFQDFKEKVDGASATS